MFLVPGLPFLVIVTVHYKEIRVFRESWQNHDILEELVILHLCNKLLWIHHENNYLVWVCLWQTNSLIASYVHSHLRQTKLLRSPRQSPAQSRVSPTAYFCDISNIKYFAWWGFPHLPLKAVVQIGVSAGRGTFVVRLHCPFLIQSRYFCATPTFNTLVSSLQSFMSHSSTSVRDFCISVSYLSSSVIAEMISVY